MYAVNKNQIIFMSLALMFVALFGGCNATKLDSKWSDREILIDGQHYDWEGSLMFLEDKGVTLGVANDDEFLYLCLISADQKTLMQAIRAGFTVWLDPEGGKSEKFGIKFPVGIKKVGMTSVDRTKKEIPEELMEIHLESFAEVEIIGPRKGEVRRNLNFLAEGIEVKAGQNHGRLVYELKIPLRTTPDRPYAIDVTEGKAIGIGFVTGKMERPQMKQGMGGRGMGGGGMGMGGGRGGGGGKGGGGMRGAGGKGRRPQPPKQMKLWVKVNLASAPKATDR